MNVKPLFDAAELMSEETHKVVLSLDRIENIDPKPTLTIKMDDEIREKQRKLFKQYNDFVLRFEGGRGKRAKQEAHIDQNRLEYAKGLVDLCVVDSAMLFAEHDNKLLKKVFVRQSSFLDYFLDVLTKAFDGDLTLSDEDEDAKKN